MNILQSIYKLVRIRTKTDVFRWAASTTIFMICFATMLVNFLHNGYFQLTVAMSVVITTILITAPATYWASYQLYLIYQLGIKFKSQAEIDPLTGLKSRRYLFDTIFSRLKRDATDYLLLMVDVDRFKSINDTHSHLVGDEVLKHVADKMKHACRRDDVVCRFGGEEFVVILPNCNFDVGKAIAERIRTEISAQKFQTQEALISVTVSIGLARGLPSSSSGSVLQAADDALYMAKESGRDRIAVNAPGLQTPEKELETSPAQRTKFRSV